VALQAPPAGLLLTLVGYFGLLFGIHRLQNSGWALPVVFALTGFMGYTLGPVLARMLALPGGAQTVRWPWRPRAHLPGPVGLGAAPARLQLHGRLPVRRHGHRPARRPGRGVLQMPALGLAVSAMVALLSAGMILFETSRIVNGGETNYVLATVGLFVSLFNLFTSLLSLFGFGSND
jgi:modulator of FtsH protease